MEEYAKKLIENEKKTHLPEIEIVGNNKGTEYNPIKMPAITVLGYPKGRNLRGNVFSTSLAYVSPFGQEWDRDYFNPYKIK